MTDARDTTDPPEDDTRHDAPRHGTAQPAATTRSAPTAPETGVAPPVDVAPELHDQTDG